MDELEISGKRYISSARAAKEHKYHSDYIGQLVRGGKVAGQKVGRAWYVDADSLAEYLGKEVPPRGPVIKKMAPVENLEDREEVVTKVESVGSEEKSVAEPVDVRDISPDLMEHETEPVETTFIMPLRKTGRSHVIAAIDDADVPVAEEIKNIEPEPAIEIEEEIIDEPAPEVKDEEETFIPLKITNESTRNIYAEPEDSFYKVSRKGLRYVSASTPVSQKVFSEDKSYAVPRIIKKEARASARAGAVTKSLSVVLVAGILSLGVGVLLSYYLHSTTVVQDSSQTSSVILSN